MAPERTKMGPASAHIRRATAADAQAIHELLVASFVGFRDQYTSSCFDATVIDARRVEQRMREGPVWVVEDSPTANGNIMGTVSANVDARGLYIRGMGVSPEARRLGIGQQLLEATEAFARSRAITTLWLSTTTFLTGSQALYRAFGFVDGPGPSDLFGTPLVSFQKVIAGE